MASRSIELLFGLGWLDRSDGDDVNILRNFSGPISPSSDDLDDLDGVSYHLEAKISHDPFRHVPFWVRAMYSQADPSEDISDAGGIGFNTLSSAVGLFGGGPFVELLNEPLRLQASIFSCRYTVIEQYRCISAVNYCI